MLVYVLGRYMASELFDNDEPQDSIRYVEAEKRDISRGDIIAVNREKAGMTIYQHFAVYIGDYKVIHYAAENGDFGGKITIHKASFDEFIKDSTQFYVLDFDSIDRSFEQYRARTPLKNAFLKPGTPTKITLKVFNEIIKIINSDDYHLYSAEETVERAESRLGETAYSLAFNNCEHFAIWCKTGLHESKQVDRVLEADIWRGGVL